MNHFPSSYPGLAEDATDSSPSRRSFLQHVATVGALAAGSALTSACATAAGATGSTNGATGAASGSATAAQPAVSPWDMSWTKKLGKYRTAYDSPEINYAAALHYASAAASGYRDALNVTREFTPVLILRHAASVMVLNDDMWKRLALGESRKVKDPTTGENALRNPFINFTAGDKHSLVGRDSALDVLMAAGALVLTCNRALMGVASMLRQKETQFTPQTALEEVRRNVLPGVYVMPNGIFAVSAAQDAGCHYMRVLV
jgi:hypothetical protein